MQTWTVQNFDQSANSSIDWSQLSFIYVCGQTVQKPAWTCFIITSLICAQTVQNQQEHANILHHVMHLPPFHHLHQPPSSHSSPKLLLLLLLLSLWLLLLSSSSRLGFCTIAYPRLQEVETGGKTETLPRNLNRSTSFTNSCRWSFTFSLSRVLMSLPPTSPTLCLLLFLLF